MSSDEIIVKITTDEPVECLFRQTPKGDGVWGKYRFVVNEPGGRCDFWVVCHRSHRKETVHCPKGNTLFVTTEPPAIKRYTNGPFLAQFGAVLTCQRNLEHPRVVLGQTGLPWYAGRVFGSRGVPPRVAMGFDDFRNAAPQKTRLLSVIVSQKTMAEGHRARLRFVEALQKRMPHTLDVYGRGSRDISDKWDAIAPYKYHIVLENSSYPDYWTEKLSDCYLAGAFPIYHGCPNVGDYFDEKAFAAIKVENIDEACRRVEEIIHSGTYERSQEVLQSAKEAVLYKYNFFPTVIAVLEQMPRRPDGAKKLTLQASHHRPFMNRVADRSALIVKTITGRTR